jgi:hypothetical protein
LPGVEVVDVIEEMSDLATFVLHEAYDLGTFLQVNSVPEMAVN